jgi:hypothetical protein
LKILTLVKQGHPESLAKLGRRHERGAVHAIADALGGRLDCGEIEHRKTCKGELEP